MSIALGRVANSVHHEGPINFKVPRQMKFDQVGVVVIGRNEGRRLIDCLTQARTVTQNVIYVDSGSTDGSSMAAKQIGAMVVALDLGKEFSAARARNEGFLALKSHLPDVRFVQFVDGDCVLLSGWIEKAISFIERHNDVAIVCGRRRERYPAASIYNQLCDLEWNTPVGEAVACGGDALVRATAFDEVGGFCSHVIAGEEPELCVRLRERGWKIWRLDANMTLHDAAMSRFSQWWVRSIRSGYGFAEVSRLHRNSPFRVWARAVPSALFWGAFLPASIVSAGVFHPILFWLALIYPLQVCSIAIRVGAIQPNRWQYAVLTIVSKFAQALGIGKFYWLRLSGRSSQLIEYKSEA
jgi:GT2 family glycosyltransferase